MVDKILAITLADELTTFTLILQVLLHFYTHRSKRFDTSLDDSREPKKFSLISN